MPDNLQFGDYRFRRFHKIFVQVDRQRLTSLWNQDRCSSNYNVEIKQTMTDAKQARNVKPGSDRSCVNDTSRAARFSRLWRSFRTFHWVITTILCVELFARHAILLYFNTTLNTTCADRYSDTQWIASSEATVFSEHGDTLERSGADLRRFWFSLCTPFACTLA